MLPQKMGYVEKWSRNSNIVENQSKINSIHSMIHL